MSASVDSLQSFVLLVAEQIERIPAAAWVGIVGAFIVAWWANRGQTERLRIQLEAENERLTEQLQYDNSRLSLELAGAATARGRERTTSMKREVYFAAISQLAKTDHLLAQTPIDEAPDLGVADGLAFELSRVELVGGKRARELATAVTSTYRNASAAALQAHEQVDAKRRELEAAELEWRSAVAQRELVVVQMESILSESTAGIINPPGMEEPGGGSATDEAGGRRCICGDGA
jgi:hypothetical protein